MSTGEEDLWRDWEKSLKISNGGTPLTSTESNWLRPSPGRNLLLVVRPGVDEVSLSNWAVRNREQINTWLFKHGGILFRGFPVGNPDEFHQVVKAVTGTMLDYQERSSLRIEVAPQIYTSTDYPKHQSIFLHNENSYQQSWPMKLFFFCETPPNSRGETPIADGRQIYARLSPAIRNRFMEHGIMYVRNFNQWSEVTWQKVFGTEEPSVVETYCAAKGIRVIWKEKGISLRTETITTCMETPDYRRTYLV